MQDILDIAIESNFVAKTNRNKMVTGADVQKAVTTKIRDSRNLVII